MNARSFVSLLVGIVLVALAAGVVANRWDSEHPVCDYEALSPIKGEYRAGSFYERELEPLGELLKLVDVPLTCIVIDAYCHLSDEKAPGLGAYLVEANHLEIPVIGVAKNRFRDSQHAVELIRGESQKPLFVTAIGMDYERASQLVGGMAGKHRIPDLLKVADRLARKIV